MPEMPEGVHAEIIRLETSDDNDYNQSEIAEIVDRSDGRVSEILKKYRHGEYLHPDTQPPIMDPTIFDYDEWVETARICMNQGGRGVAIARKILSNIPDDEIGGDGSPNL